MYSGAQLGILRGRGPNQKKRAHTPDHSKAVMSSGMSVSLNQKAMAEIKVYFSNVCICVCINVVTEDGWFGGGGGLSREIFLNDTL